MHLQILAISNGACGCFVQIFSLLLLSPFILIVCGRGYNSEILQFGNRCCLWQLGCPLIKVLFVLRFMNKSYH